LCCVSIPSNRGGHFYLVEPLRSPSWPRSLNPLKSGRSFLLDGARERFSVAVYVSIPSNRGGHFYCDCERNAAVLGVRLNPLKSGRSFLPSMRLMLTWPKKPSLNPLKSGRSFLLYSKKNFFVHKRSLNPLKSGRSFLHTMYFTETEEWIGSQSPQIGAVISTWCCGHKDAYWEVRLNPLKSGRSFLLNAWSAEAL